MKLPESIRSVAYLRGVVIDISDNQYGNRLRDEEREQAHEDAIQLELDAHRSAIDAKDDVLRAKIALLELDRAKLASERADVDAVASKLHTVTAVRNVRRAKSELGAKN